MKYLSKCAIVFSSLFFADRLTKWLAVLYLQKKDLPIFLYLQLSFSWNRGVSWGMFGNSSQAGFYLLTAIIAGIIILFSVFTVMQYRNQEPILFELCIVAGALSNFFDRIYYGAVVDFILFYINSWQWPIFNVADACIVIGIGGVILRGLLWMNKKQPSR